jgi:hypothetical protein
MRKTLFGVLVALGLQFPIGISQSIISPDVISIQPNEDAVVKLAGANIGFLSNRRGIMIETSGGSGLRGASVASEQDPLGPTRPGIVYNYSMQLYGLVSGELSFELQSGADPRSFNWAPTAAPELLVSPSVYVVRVTSGSEFLRVLAMLHKSKSVRWVEPAIQYVPQVIE